MTRVSSPPSEEKFTFLWMKSQKSSLKDWILKNICFNVNLEFWNSLKTSRLPSQAYHLYRAVLTSNLCDTKGWISILYTNIASYQHWICLHPQKILSILRIQPIKHISNMQKSFQKYVMLIIYVLKFYMKTSFHKVNHDECLLRIFPAEISKACN